MSTKNTTSKYNDPADEFTSMVITEEEGQKEYNGDDDFHSFTESSLIVNKNITTASTIATNSSTGSSSDENHHRGPQEEKKDEMIQLINDKDGTTISITSNVNNSSIDGTNKDNNKKNNDVDNNNDSNTITRSNDESEQLIFTKTSSPNRNNNNVNENTNNTKNDNTTTTISNNNSKNNNPTSKRYVTPQDFDLLKVIGMGAFGKVLQVKNKKSQQILAMKVISKRLLKRKTTYIENVQAEREILTKVNHPFIVTMHCSFQTKEKLFIIMDFLAGGELFLRLGREGIFLEKTAAFYISEIVLALEHLHSKGILHRDLKPENILLSSDGHICLTDFGLAKDFQWDEGEVNEDGKALTVCGTQEYMAPEMIARKGYGKAADWWSLGCISYEMLSGNPPFESRKGAKDLFNKIMNDKVKMPDYASAAACVLLKGLLNRNATKRFGAAKGTMFQVGGVAQVKQLDFFSKIDWGLLEEKKLEPPDKLDVDDDNDLRHFYDEFTTMGLPRSVKEMSHENFKPRRCQSGAFRGFSFIHDDFVLPERSDEHAEQYWNNVDEDGESQSDCASSIGGVDDDATVPNKALRGGEMTTSLDPTPEVEAKKKRPPRKKKKKQPPTLESNQESTKVIGSSSELMGGKDIIPESTEIKRYDEKLGRNAEGAIHFSSEKKPLSSTVNPIKVDADETSVQTNTIETSTKVEDVDTSSKSSVSAGFAIKSSNQVKSTTTASTWETVGKPKKSAINTPSLGTAGQSATSSANETPWSAVKQNNASNDWKIKSTSSKPISNGQSRQQQAPSITKSLPPNGWSCVTRVASNDPQPSGISKQTITSKRSIALGVSGASDWRSHTLTRNISNSSSKGSRITKSVPTPTSMSVVSGGWPSLGADRPKSSTEQVEDWPSLGGNLVPQSVVSKAPQGPWVKKTSLAQNAWGKNT